MGASYEAPNLAAANREAVEAQAETYPKLRAWDAAARLGKKVIYQDQEYDFTGIGDVDTGDFSFVLLFFGEPTDPDFIQLDQDMNGFIDTADSSLVLLNYGTCP